VVLEHDRDGRGLGETGVGEELPLPAFDVDLEQIGLGGERQHVAGLHQPALGREQGRSLHEREGAADLGVLLRERGPAGHAGEMKVAVELDPAVPRGRAGLHEAPPLLQAVGLDATAQHGRVARVGLERDHARPRITGEHEQGEEPHVSTQIEDAGPPAKGPHGLRHALGRPVGPKAEDLLQDPHVEQRVPDLNGEPGTPQPVAVLRRCPPQLAPQKPAALLDAGRGPERTAQALGPRYLHAHRV